MVAEPTSWWQSQPTIVRSKISLNYTVNETKLKLAATVAEPTAFKIKKISSRAHCLSQGSSFKQSNQQKWQRNAIA